MAMTARISEAIAAARLITSGVDTLNPLLWKLRQVYTPPYHFFQYLRLVRKTLDYLGAPREL
jgi:hypothetical protein